jgi:hypothetical protein
MTKSQVSRPWLRFLSWGVFCAVALPALIALNITGCGGRESKFDRKAIYGKVVGAEGRNGTAAFTPIDTSIGPAAMTDFENGAYRFTEDDGPVPGEYNVYVELEVPASEARKSKPGGRTTKNPADVGRPTYDEAEVIKISVSVDGPWEIDLNVAQ